MLFNSKLSSSTIEETRLLCSSFWQMFTKMRNLTNYDTCSVTWSLVTSIGSGHVPYVRNHLLRMLFGEMNKLSEALWTSEFVALWPRTWNHIYYNQTTFYHFWRNGSLPSKILSTLLDQKANFRKFNFYLFQTKILSQPQSVIINRLL